MIERIKHIFIAETTNDLRTIRDQMDLETTLCMSKGLVEIVFRTMHTIKGSAPMFGYPMLSNIAVPIAKVYEGIHYNNHPQNEMLKEKTSAIIDTLMDALHDTVAYDSLAQDYVDEVSDFFNNTYKINSQSDDR